MLKLTSRESFLWRPIDLKSLLEYTLQTIISEWRRFDKSDNLLWTSLQRFNWKIIKMYELNAYLRNNIYTNSLDSDRHYQIVTLIDLQFLAMKLSLVGILINPFPSFETYSISLPMLRLVLLNLLALLIVLSWVLLQAKHLGLQLFGETRYSKIINHPLDR